MRRMDALLTEDERAILASVDGFASRHLPPDEVRRRDREHQRPMTCCRPWARPASSPCPCRTITAVSGAAGARCAGAGAPRLARLHGGLDLQSRRRLRRHVGADLWITGAEARPAAGPPLRILLHGPRPDRAGRGSDAGALKTRARRTSGGYVISGSKIWISDAKGARFLLTAARTGEAAKGSDGITLFLVPSDAPGSRSRRSPRSATTACRASRWALPMSRSAMTR